MLSVTPTQCLAEANAKAFHIMSAFERFDNSLICAMMSLDIVLVLYCLFYFVSVCFLIKIKLLF